MRSQEISGLGTSLFVTRGLYAVSLGDARASIEDQGSFVIDRLSNMSAEDVEMVTRSVAGLFCGLVDGIAKVLAQRAADNNASDEQIEPCLPRDLCQVRTSTFYLMVTKKSRAYSLEGVARSPLRRLKKSTRICFAPTEMSRH